MKTKPLLREAIKGVLGDYRNYVVESITLQPTSVKYRKINQSQATTQIISTLIKEIRGKMPEKPSNELIQLLLQNGKPQQAASYNGFSAVIDQVLSILNEMEKS